MSGWLPPVTFWPRPSGGRRQHRVLRGLYAARAALSELDLNARSHHLPVADGAQRLVEAVDEAFGDR